MRPRYGAWLSLLVMGVLAACSDDRETYTQTAGGYTMAMRISPQPPEAGKTAVVTAVLHYEGRGTLATCPVKFRQYPADRAPAATDQTGYHPMRQDQTSRIYQGDSAPFTGVGKWIIEFQADCDKTIYDMKFPLFVVKPD